VFVKFAAEHKGCPSAFETIPRRFVAMPQRSHGDAGVLHGDLVTIQIAVRTPPQCDRGLKIKSNICRILENTNEICKMEPDILIRIWNAPGHHPKSNNEVIYI
jgi:hypothetical protein